MPSLRTPEGKRRYQEYLSANPATGSCALCEKVALKEFEYWKIIENSFPYDLIAQTHHMIAPLRHVNEAGLNVEERAGLSSIKADVIDKEYDYVVETTSKNRSIPEHFHLHLLIGIRSK